MSIFTQALTLLMQILIVCALAILLLRPWIKFGILNPKKKGLNIIDRFCLFVYSSIAAVFIFVGVFVTTILALMISILIPDRRKLFHINGKFWSGLYLKIICVDIKVVGAENIPDNQVIYVQNIETYIDGAASLSKIKGSYRSVFPRHLFEVPVFGWLEKLTGYLALEQGEISLMHKDIVDILKTLKRGDNLLTFADESSRIFDVHGGVVLLALQSGLPVLPVVITRKMTSPQVGAFLVKPFPYEIMIKIGKPITLSVHVDDKLNRQKAKEQITKEMYSLLQSS